MSLPPNPTDYLDRARKVIAAEAAAVQSAAQAVDESFVEVIRGSLPISASLLAAENSPLKPKSCQSGTPVIGVALPNTTNPYYVAMRQGFIDGAKELGFKVNIQIANDDNEAQLAQVQGFIQQQVCAIALNAVKSGPGALKQRLLTNPGYPFLP